MRVFLFLFLILLVSCGRDVTQFDGTIQEHAPVKMREGVFSLGPEEKIDTEKILSIADLIDAALKNNPETKSAWYRARVSAARLGVARSELYPKIDAKADGSHIRTFEFLGGPVIVDNRAGAGLMLSYLLLDFGERSASIDAAKEGLKIAHWSSDWKIQQVLIGLLGRYYEYLNAKGLLEAEEASIGDAKSRVEATEDLCRAGLKSRSDLLAAKSDLIQARLKLGERKRAAAVAMGGLAKAMGISVDVQLQVENVPEGIELSKVTENIDALIARAKLKRADLLALSGEMARKNLELKKTRASLWPKIGASANSGWAYDEKSPSHGIFNYSVGVSLNAPLFAGFRKTYECRRAYAEAQETLADLRDRESEISLDVLRNFEALKTAEEKICLSREYLEYAEEGYQSALENYRAGVINIFSLIDSGKILSLARESKAQAKINWFAAIAQLAYATGSLLEE
ncbi:MAG: TolC family protein [Verrucomicrobia bacterium]|nr:TolC family protein [Verrucomicrobiota bacterium]